MSYIQLKNITKKFGSFTANHNINLDIPRGSIQAIIGENGAGKSTLMSILSGLYQPDEGQIYLNDQPIQITSPAAAIELGIGMIYQHFQLVPQLTVTENIILGTTNSWNLSLGKQRQKILELSQLYRLEIDPQQKVADLAVGMQQRVEILKVLYRNAQIIILDEPTAVLTPGEVDALIEILRQLALSGSTIVFISHKLDEVMRLCANLPSSNSHPNQITVLRRGQVVSHVAANQVTTSQLAELMVGETQRLNLSNQTEKSPQLGQVVLSIENLQVKNQQNILAVDGVSFEIRSGEILGVAGVDGNGQRELADAICGLISEHSGKIKILGQIISCQQRKRAIAYIPEDRQTQGLIGQLNIAENLILKNFPRSPFCRGGFLQTQVIKNNAQQAVKEFDIRTPKLDIAVQSLSGGNQQKIVLARELAGEPALIVAMQPTRGLDIAAANGVQQRLIDQKQKNTAILYISTELEELMAICDRIAIMYKGQFIDILDAQTATLDLIGFLMGGGNSAAKTGEA